MIDLCLSISFKSATVPIITEPCNVNGFVFRELDFGAASALVHKHHYSHDLPRVVRKNFGAFKNGKLQAAACYGPCVSRKAPISWLELRRLVKLPKSDLVLSQFLSWTLRQLSQNKVECVLSWADPEQDHHGGIYQATNWLYTEQRGGGNHTFIDTDGKHIHPRTVYARFGTQSVPRVLALNPGWTSFLPKTKHRYMMPLNIRAKKALAMLKTKVMVYPKPERGLSIGRTNPIRASQVQPLKAAPLSINITLEFPGWPV